MDRRTFLQLTGLGAFAPLAAASCSRDRGWSNSTGSGAPAAEPVLVSLASPDRVLAAEVPQRVPLGLVGAGNLISDADTLGLRVLLDGDLIDEASVVAHVILHDHVADTADDGHQHSDLQRYYPLRVTFPAPGIYDIEAIANPNDGPIARVVLQVFDRAEVAVPLPGDLIVPLSTPTFDDPRGVEQLCTRFEPCALHEVDAAELQAAAKPFALLIATPALCQTAYCGPVVDTLVEAVEAVGGIDAIHAEVYANPLEVAGDYSDPRIQVAPAVSALGLTFEPALFLIGADGLLVDRIDNVFDLAEAIEALERLKQTGETVDE